MIANQHHSLEAGGTALVGLEKHGNKGLNFKNLSQSQRGGRKSMDVVA
jgi:hypothetical protein